ncbi:MAG TPA: SirB2 family protein [Steroidobacteraceae bacterium]|nr:SirB2 family protein [Steroidobacteraceae bacterium]
MLEFYPQIKWVHVAAVIASGSLFMLRGAGVLGGMRWPMWAPLRYLTYTIDTVLLTAALMLATILHQYPFVHAWLTAKVLLLVLYIVLGTLALKRARTRAARAGFYAAALGVFLVIVSVARTHSPLGFLAYFR